MEGQGLDPGEHRGNVCSQMCPDSRICAHAQCTHKTEEQISEETDWLAAMGAASRSTF